MRKGFKTSWTTERVFISAPGKDHDSLLLTNTFAGVCDGATPLFGASAEVARAFARDSLARLAESSSGTLNAPSAASVAICRLAQYYEKGPRAPSACVAWCSISSDMLTIAVLGNCQAIVGNGSKNWHATITDRRVDSFDDVVVKRHQRLIGSGIGRDISHIEREKTIQQNRLAMNQPDSYYLFTTDERVSLEVTWICMPAEEPDTILLTTDGFARCERPFALVPTIEELFWSARSDPAIMARIAGEVRQLEKSDPACIQYPRLGQYDDLTALLLKRASE